MEGKTSPFTGEPGPTGKKRRNKLKQASKVSAMKGRQTRLMAQFTGNSCYYQYSISLRLLLDSGSSENICSEEFVRNHDLLFDATQPRTYEMIDGTKTNAIGWEWWQCTIMGIEMTVEFAVLKSAELEQAVLGLQWLRQYEVQMHFGTREITIG